VFGQFWDFDRLVQDKVTRRRGDLALDQVLRKHLVIFDHFWNFNSLSKMEHNAKQRSWKLDPFLGSFLGFWG
jgi:hypothetical protein